MVDNTPIPVTVLRGLPEHTDTAQRELITAAISAALTTVAAESAATSGRYTDPRAALRRHPRGGWGLPGPTPLRHSGYNPAGFRA